MTQPCFEKEPLIFRFKNKTFQLFLWIWTSNTVSICPGPPLDFDSSLLYLPYLWPINLKCWLSKLYHYTYLNFLYEIIFQIKVFSNVWKPRKHISLVNFKEWEKNHWKTLFGQTILSIHHIFWVPYGRIEAKEEWTKEERPKLQTFLNIFFISIFTLHIVENRLFYFQFCRKF